MIHRVHGNLLFVPEVACEIFDTMGKTNLNRRTYELCNFTMTQNIRSNSLKNDLKERSCEFWICQVKAQFLILFWFCGMIWNGLCVQDTPQTEIAGKICVLSCGWNSLTFRFCSMCIIIFVDIPVNSSENDFIGMFIRTKIIYMKLKRI